VASPARGITVIKVIDELLEMSALPVENLITIIPCLVPLGFGSGILTRGPRVTGTGLSFPHNPNPSGPLRPSELCVPLLYIR